MVKKKIIKTKLKTAGQEIDEHMKNVQQLDNVTPHELSQDMLAKDFDEQMTGWIREAKQVFDGDFFVVLNLKLEKSLGNAPHLIPECRQTCPDPFYDQSVWHFKRDDEELEFLWSVPDIGTTKLFKDDPLNCPEDQVQLRNFVLDYCDGTLQKRANSLNATILRSRDGRKQQLGAAA
jgi:hypothetical protein